MERKVEDLVSIIVACHNGERYIDECFESLVKQTYENIEIIVCDDASTDNSVSKLQEWCKRDPRIKLLINENNLNIAATRNKCIKSSGGRYIVIQDVDDVSKTNRIEILLQTLKESNMAFVSSSVAAFSKSHKEVDHIYSFQKKIPSKWSFLFGVPFFHPSTIFTCDCLKKVKGYRVAEETRRAEDYDIYMRLYASGYKGMTIPDVLYYYRLDAGNYKRRTFSGRRGEMKVRRQGFKALGLLPWGWPFVFKPLLAHVVMHARLLIKL